MAYVSLLIATYNRLSLSQKYIPGILNNIGNIDADILIWDNGSTDGTLDWLMDYKYCDPRITEVFCADQNIGMEAYNYLAKASNSKYILKVDDDITVPSNFVKRLVYAYEAINEPKLLYLGFDMRWTAKSFGTRSGMHLYKKPLGNIYNLPNSDRVLVHYHPRTWMVNGVCRLSPRETFLNLGGHPIGVKYGIDSIVSRIAEENGYYIGYLNSKDFVVHYGHNEDPNYRNMKNIELRKTKQLK